MILFLYRYALKKANNRLLKILLDVVKTTSAAEETIGRHVLGILDRSSKSQPATSLLWRSETEASATVCVQEECARGNSSVCFEIMHIFNIGSARGTQDNPHLQHRLSSRYSQDTEMYTRKNSQRFWTAIHSVTHINGLSHTKILNLLFSTTIIV